MCIDSAPEARPFIVSSSKHLIDFFNFSLRHSPPNNTTLRSYCNYFHLVELFFLSDPPAKINGAFCRTIAGF
jgi:hypothetical protein